MKQVTQIFLEGESLTLKFQELFYFVEIWTILKRDAVLFD